MTETQGVEPAGSVLDRILHAKRKEVEGLAGRRRALEAAVGRAPEARDFPGALTAGDRVALIAEVKRRSPGAGEIRPDLDPARMVLSYAEGGAAAVSVLTDGEHFGGGLQDLEAARGAASLPVLRKDFILDEHQVLEARGAGADAVLLIVRILDDARLRRLLEVTRELGMEALVETHDEEEVARALDSGARVVGVNNRDLTTFETSLSVTERLLPYVAHDTVVVSESGIQTGEDVRRLGQVGVDAVLVGEALLRQEDSARAAADLAGWPRKARPVGSPGGGRP